jgi:uncharacterized iron-regulated membrane protein
MRNKMALLQTPDSVLPSAQKQQLTAWQQWIQRPQNLWLRKALFQVHLWVGIGVGLYVLLISLSGSAIVFRRQLETKFARKEAFVAVSGPRLSEDALSQRALQDYSGYKVADIFESKRLDRPVSVVLQRGKTRFERLYNPYTGADLGDPQSPMERLLESTVDFHDNLLSGDSGRLANGIGSILVCLLSITGIVIWWPGSNNWRRSLGISWKASFPLFNWTLHSAVGFWCSLFVLTWAVSGIYFSFPHPFEALWGNDSQFLVWLARIHFGRFGRAGLKNWTLGTIWMIFGLVPAILFVTGALMWWNRVLRKDRHPLE